VNASAPEFPAGRFPARVLAATTVGGVALTETVYAPATALARHRHERACLVYVANGRFSERSGGELRTCGPGMVIVRSPGEPHAEEFPEAARCLNVELPSQARPVRSAALAGGLLPPLLRAVYAEFRRRDGVAAAALATLLARVERYAGEDPAPHEPRAPVDAERVRAFIDAHLHEALTMERLAAVFGARTGAVQSAFRARFGRTVAQHVRERRAAVACEALERGDDSLAAIAVRAGFTDQSHMTHALRRRFGRTPGELRRNAAAAG
jgi:AraC family transcriptional regulator